MSVNRRFIIVFRLVVVAVGLALLVLGCGGGDAGDEVVTESGDTTDDPAADDATATTSNGDGTDSDSADDPETEIDEVEARNTLTSFVDTLATGDYATVAGDLLLVGLSPEILEQLGLDEETSSEPATLIDALAVYCRLTDCQAAYTISDLVESDSMSTVFDVEVEQSDGESATARVPVSVVDGRYRVGLLPFGSPAMPGSEDAMPGDGEVPSYPGEDSGQGWRVAPVAERDPLVLVWRPTEVLRPGHTGQYSSVATGQFVAVVDVGSGIAFQSERPYDSPDADDTIWLQSGETTALVESTADEYVTLEGSRVLDIDEAVVYYQVRSGTMPEDTKSRLYQVNTLSGQVDEIAIVGGWESGVDFFDFSAAYPQVGGAWGAEGYTGIVVLDLTSGATVYDSDASGESCFDGQPDCPWYRVLTFDGDAVYGIRPYWGSGDVITAQSLYRFDLNAGVETEIARFGWDNGLWYPRNIMIMGDEVIVSLEDGSENPLPAVIVDVTTGLAATHSLAGFVGPVSLS